MLNTNIWTDISDGINIVSNALRGIGTMFGPQQQMGTPPQMDMNMSRRELPCYQQPNYNMNPNCWSNPMTNMQYGFTAPVYTPYIPGITDPRYGILPQTTMGQYYQQSNMYANPNTNMYCQLPQYQSPFMNNNNTVYGYPSGGRYGY